jgi:hypothetical protein
MPRSSSSPDGLLERVAKVFVAHVPLSRSACYSFPAINIDLTSRSFAMEWTTPQHEEIDLNCEISSYANAEL